MKIKILKPLAGHKVGDVITIEDVRGVPTSLYWRGRLKDAKIDGCIEKVAAQTQARENEPQVETPKKGKK